MTRKDYNLLAACFREALRDAQRPGATTLDGIRDVLARVTLALELDNPRFDKGKFAEAIVIPTDGF